MFWLHSRFPRKTRLKWIAVFILCVCITSMALKVMMMKFAWDNYVEYAWGDNELRPKSKLGFSGGAPFGGPKLGLTIIDSLDTLFIMGLTEEFEAGTRWIRDNFDFASAKSTFSVFEANIRFLGGFLSIHALSGNKLFLEKAIVVADILMLALNTTSGLPWSLFDATSQKGYLYSWLSADCVFLADAGTLHLEFAYLSEITGDPSYLQKVQHIRQLLRNSRSEDGLYPNHLDFRNENGSKCSNGVSVSVGAFADSFYEYLLKAWLLSGKRDAEAKLMFDAALVSLEKHLLKTSVSGLKYFAKLENNRQIVHTMEHLACFIGGLYALAAEDSAQQLDTLTMARDITKTCRISYNSTKTGLGPESFVIDGSGQPATQFSGDRQYSLRPEVVESYYYLWKISGDELYREWAWDAIQAIEKHCKTLNGYSGIDDVGVEKPNFDDIQQSYFMAETLKYLYLIFVEDDNITLDSWVFNTEAHPLPVIGSEPFKAAFLAWRGFPYSVTPPVIARDLRFSVSGVDNKSSAISRLPDLFLLLFLVGLLLRC